MIPDHMKEDSLTRLWLSTQFVKCRLCVHVRRGDFLTSYPHVPSFSNFTQAAIRFLVQNGLGLRSDHFLVSMTNRTGIIMIGNDPKWEREVLRNLSLSVPDLVLPYEENYPPTFDWIISQFYCDYVLITGACDKRPQYFSIGVHFWLLSGLPVQRATGVLQRQTITRQRGSLDGPRGLLLSDVEAASFS